MSNFARTPSELRENAELWWPAALASKETKASVIPRLIATLDKFIGVLHVADSGPEAWRSILPHTDDLPGNLFLKHLMILADVGGEPLERLTLEPKRVFPKGTLSYVWRNELHEYRFQMLMESRLDNSRLHVDGASLSNPVDLSPLMIDTAMLLLHGSASTDGIPEHLADKCIIGSMIGYQQELAKFVRERYIWVSRITRGATANAMGQIAQDHVLNELRGRLPKWKFVRNGKIPLISQTGGRTLTSFDIVGMSPSGKYAAIEVSFQVTTNSTIERKSGQAAARRAVLSRAGHAIVYVIDGAGNFERSSALTTICANSDCTVTLRSSEFDVLASFLSSWDSAKPATSRRR